MARRTIVVGHQPVHDGRAVDGHHRRPGQRPRTRQADRQAALQIQNVGAASVAGLAIVLMAIMLDRTTTAASERATGRTNVASASGMGVMLTGVVLERLPRWATEDAGTRCSAASAHHGGPLAAAAGSCSSRSSSASTSPASSSTSPCSPTSATRRCSSGSAARSSTKRINDFTELVRRHGRHLHHRVQERHHQLADQPAPGPARPVALVADGRWCCWPSRTCSAAGGRW